MWSFNFKRPQNPISTLSKRSLREINIHQEALALRTHFKEILKTLRDHHLEKLPWYIVLGPEKSGKTTLLSHPFYHWMATIPSFFAAPTPKTIPIASELFHPICARICQEGVFIEIPGRYLQERINKNTIFGLFLHLLKKNKINSLIQGIILVLGLDDLTKLPMQKHQEQISALRHCLLEIAQITKHSINLQMLLTKADTFIGFNEFFSEALQEERLDAFGIELSGEAFNSTIPTSQAVSEQFIALLKKLNERIIWLLHRERLISKRALIADFPQQLSSFKELFTHYIYNLFDIAAYQNKILLKNIYFCSSTQQGETIDYLAKLLNTYELPERIATTEFLKPKSYFVSRLLKKMTSLPKGAQFSPSEILILPRHTKFIAAFLLIFIPIIYLSFDFYQKSKAINHLEKEFKINSHLNLSGESSQALVNQALVLSSLKKILQLQKEIPFSFLINFKLHPLHNLSLQADQDYQQILQYHFIPLLKNTLTNQLLNASISNPASLYATLKAYLALGNPQKNADYLSAWLKSYLSAETIKINEKKFHLPEMNFSSWPPIQPDSAAIFHAQSVLNQLPKAFLAYLILKGEILPTFDPFPSEFDKAFIYSGKTREIPIIYTREKIANIYFEQIPAFTRAAFSGNDVLGKQFFTEINTNEFNNVVAQVREFYFQDYAVHWLHILDHTQIKLANNFQQALSILDTLSKKDSPLALLLKEVNNQTTIDISALSKQRTHLEQQNFYTNFKNYFNVDNTASRILTAKPDLINHAIPNEISKLKKVVENISKAPDVKKASFQMVKNEYETQKTFGAIAKIAFEMPQPLSRWLISLISNDWLILLQTTHAYTNQLWQNLVLPEYHAKLSERYPFVKQSTIDVELADFAHFFGKAGTLDAFFSQYLSPFIDVNKPRWQWKELYGQTLSNNDNFPLQLERAVLIRKMFFSKNDELSVEFYLMPMGMTPTLKNVQLSIEGQQITAQTQNLTSMPLMWPSTKNNDGSNLIFFKQTGEQVLIAQKGPWSLFRLLDGALLQPLKETKQYLVTFDLNGNAAKYQLMAENTLNPFIPNFVSQFCCSEAF